MPLFYPKKCLTMRERMEAINTKQCSFTLDWVLSLDGSSCIDRLRRTLKIVIKIFTEKNVSFCPCKKIKWKLY